MQRNHAAHYTAHYVTRWRLLRAHVRRPPLPCDQPPLEAGASLLGRRYLREGGRRLAVLRRAAHRALQLLALDRNDPRELAHLLRGRARGAARTDTLLPRTSIDVDHLSGDVSFVKMNMTLFKSDSNTVRRVTRPWASR